MRAESATAVLGSFIAIVLIIGTSSYPAHLPPETLLAPDRERTLDLTSPVILWTSPAHGQLAYPNADIVIQFNESMSTSSFSYEFLSGWDPGMNWSWESSVHENDTVRGTHDILFGSLAYYEFNVTYAEDLAGNPLAPGPVPNPWNWSTIVVIIETVPADGETNVSLSQDIMVFFSGPVDVLTLPVIFWTIVPDPGGGWAITWTNGDTSVVLSHGVPFEPCALYTVYLHIGLSPFPSLVPNPWSFTTVCPSRVIRTDPYDGQMDVPLNHSIEVEFSKPMNTGTVMWTINPDPGGWNQSWSGNNTVLTLSHTILFLDCQTYTVQIVGGQDLDGYDLIPGADLVPNPWSFMTVRLPKIIMTDPTDGQVDAPLDQVISVVFSLPMNTTSVSWTVIPFIDMFPFWDSNDTNLTLLPMQLFEQLTAYSVEIQGKDKGGNDLIAGPVPNPWTFYTGIKEHMLKSTDPYHGEVNVALTRPITVEFSRSIEVPTFSYTIIPFISLTMNWMNEDKTVMFTHSDEFESLTAYTMTVSGNDLDGLPIQPGPIPNPWSWTTRAKPLAPPTNVSAFLSGPSLRDVIVTWQLSDDDFPGGNVSYYDVYRGDVYDAGGAGYGLLGSVPSGVSQYVDQLAGQDANCYYYFVCSAQFSGEPSCSEDQAGKFTRPLVQGPNLLSLPLIQSNESPEYVLQTVIYDMAWFYDSSSGEWRWHMRSKEYGGLTGVNHTMGLWVNVTGDCKFTLAGTVPAQTAIHLHKGWNLVSFASFNTSYTVANLKAELSVERVEGFDASSPPHFLEVLNDSDLLMAGRGYWIKVSQDVIWGVSNA